MKQEMINHPPHYRKGRYEAVKVIDAWNLNFNLGNAIKYICRHDQKGGLEDLKKAKWYLSHEIRRRQRASTRARAKSQEAPDQKRDRNPSDS